MGLSTSPDWLYAAVDADGHVLRGGERDGRLYTTPGPAKRAAWQPGHQVVQIPVSAGTVIFTRKEKCSES